MAPSTPGNVVKARLNNKTTKRRWLLNGVGCWQDIFTYVKILPIRKSLPLTTNAIIPVVLSVLFNFDQASDNIK